MTRKNQAPVAMNSSFGSRFDSSSDEVSLRDVVVDFQRGQDKLVLSFDANTALAGSQDFVFDTAPFVANAPGLIRLKAVSATSVLVLANIDNDADAEFGVLVRGTATLSADDFLL